MSTSDALCKFWLSMITMPRLAEEGLLRGISGNSKASPRLRFGLVCGPRRTNPMRKRGLCVTH
jgi:hypothetical protein